MTADEQRAQWRKHKRAQRARDPELYRQKCRAYYLLNRGKILERQKAYYRDVWKLKESGIAPEKARVRKQAQRQRGRAITIRTVS